VRGAGPARRNHVVVLLLERPALLQLFAPGVIGQLGERRFAGKLVSK
jgi:hypothetical protein